MTSRGQPAETHSTQEMSLRGDSCAPRVLLVTPQPFFEERGTPIAVALTSRALVESGYAVDVLAFPVGSDPHIQGVRVLRCGNPLGIRQVRVGFSLKKMLLDASLLMEFRRLLGSGHYAVVHAVEEAAWLASMLCPARDVPFIYDMASSIPEQVAEHPLLGHALPQRLLRYLEREVINRATHVVCSGGLGSHVLAQSPRVPVTEWRFPVLQERATAQMVAKLRDQHDIRADSRVVLYTGNFSSYQGIDLLLEAFMHAAAGDASLMLVCVGASGPEQVEELQSRLPAALLSRVRLLPRQPRALMPAWFEIAGCLVSLRTLGDNIPLKVFEYMAAHRPIVATRGAAHEPILNDQRAFLCAADADDVARTIHAVFADPAHARRVADAAAEHARCNFSWSRFRQLVAGVYGRVLQSRVAVANRCPVRQN